MKDNTYVDCGYGILQDNVHKHKAWVQSPQLAGGDGCGEMNDDTVHITYAHWKGQTVSRDTLRKIGYDLPQGVWFLLTHCAHHTVGMYSDPVLGRPGERLYTPGSEIPYFDGVLYRLASQDAPSLFWYSAGGVNLISWLQHLSWLSFLQRDYVHARSRRFWSVSLKNMGDPRLEADYA